MANRNIFLIIAVVAAIILLGVVYLPEENVMLSRGPGHPDSIPVNSSPNDLDNGCEIYGSVGGFPKSPVTPTLPPKNNKDYNSPDMYVHILRLISVRKQEILKRLLLAKYLRLIHMLLIQ